jgi:hypothetical protein
MTFFTWLSSKLNKKTKISMSIPDVFEEHEERVVGSTDAYVVTREQKIIQTENGPTHCTNICITLK